MATPTVNDFILYTNMPIENTDYTFNWAKLVSYLTDGTENFTIGNLICSAISGIENITVTGQYLGTQTIPTDTIADGAITDAKIATNALDGNKIQVGSIAANRLADGAIGTAQLADGAIGTAQLADGAIVASKFAVGQNVDGNQLTTASVAANRLAGGITYAYLTGLTANIGVSGGYLHFQNGLLTRCDESPT